MSAEPPTNLAASVRNRLLEVIRRTGTEAMLVWTRYAIERLLYRLSVSRHSGSFVLKGAVLFLAWGRRNLRPTRDLDLLGFGEDSAERIAEIFREICNVDCEPDGLVFDASSVTVANIREDQIYQGKRVQLSAHLGKSAIRLQVDVGFGDAVTPPPQEITYPVLLNFPAPRIRAYARETVVAEKLHAMVEHGVLTSRMKDFYDVLVLSREFDFAGAPLISAITATFGRRGAAPPAVPRVLTDEYASDQAGNTRWKAFVRKGRLADAPPLPAAIAGLRDFLLPPLEHIAGGKDEPFLKTWARGGPWR